MRVKVKSISELTDVDYVSRRIESMGWRVAAFGDELFVTMGEFTSVEAGFQLAQYLNNNDGLLEYMVDDETNGRWDNVAKDVIKSDTLADLRRLAAEEQIRRSDPT